MFSNRLPWHLPQNRLSVLLLSKRQAKEPLLDLTVANPTVALPELYEQDGVALLSALSDPAGLRYQPSARGDKGTRRAVAAYYAGRGIPLDSEQLVLCASTSEAYSWLFQLLCNPGQEVLFPQPSYPLLEFLGSLAGVKTVPYPLYFDGRWRIDVAGLRDALSPSTRAIVLVSPNNPTGSVVHAAELRALSALCAEHQLALIVDEVFGDYLLEAPAVPEPDDPALSSVLAAPAARLPPLCFVLSGLSKVVGLPQLKLGWIYVAGDEPLRGQAQDRLEIIADTFLSVSTPVQLAAPRILLEQPRVSAAISARTRKNLAHLRKATADTSLQVLPVEGGWYAVVRLPKLCSEEEWVETLLQRDNLLCHPGYFFDFPTEAYLVLSLLSPPPELCEGIARLLARVQALQ
jgi:aspartate/methionine/tyrosine aminotransferase